MRLVDSLHMRTDNLKLRKKYVGEIFIALGSKSNIKSSWKQEIKFSGHKKKKSEMSGSIKRSVVKLEFNVLAFYKAHVKQGKWYWRWRPYDRIMPRTQEELPSHLRFTADPVRELWHYYESLGCTTVFRENVIVASVPWLDEENSFEVFIIVNLHVLYPGKGEQWQNLDWKWII